jgi:nitroimidazol reductase NimA-like FMN-containing flavoprotein (pyridoxamine 5'-phosphate oxidase superfamily)
VPELADIARGVIDTNTYLALGTAGPSGTPWVTPVYYTPDGYTDFYWVSSPDALHSRNIAQRPDVSIVIYDSHSPVGRAEAVYMTARATLVPDEELQQSAAIYNRRLPQLKGFELDELLAPALFRLYRANATAHSVLIRGSDPQYGRGADSRMTVTIDPHPDATA